MQEVSRWQIDHLCFRTESEEDYVVTKTLITEFADLLIESPINGRLIATYKLRKEILCGDHFVDVIEVPAPKAGRPYARGLEHMEVVVDEPLENLRGRYAHLEWDDRNIAHPSNADISLCFGGASVKFHTEPLEKIIEREKSRCESKGNPR